MQKVIFGFAVLCLLGSASAEPMLPPSFEERCDQSTNVVLAQYRALDPASSRTRIDYFNPPVAVFKRLRTLKGNEAASEIRIRFDFHDGSACIAPPEWKFESAKMPTEGNLFILFLTKRDNQGIYETYRGDFGRFQQSPDTDINDRIIDDCLRKSTPSRRRRM